MQKKAIGIFLFTLLITISFIPISNAINIGNPSFFDGIIELVPMEQTIYNNEEKADLVVTNIRPSWIDAPITDGTECTIKNRGDAPTEGTIDV